MCRDIRWREKQERSFVKSRAGTVTDVKWWGKRHITFSYIPFKLFHRKPTFGYFYLKICIQRRYLSRKKYQMNIKLKCNEAQALSLPCNCYWMVMVYAYSTGNFILTMKTHFSLAITQIFRFFTLKIFAPRH